MVYYYKLKVDFYKLLAYFFIMRKSAYAVKLDKQLLDELKEFCEEKGYTQSAFVAKALRQQMIQEELKEDIFDLVSLRPQESMARPFKAYRRDRQ